MREFFKKHTAASLIVLLFAITIVLSWIIPYSSFNGAELVKAERTYVGFSDLATIFTTSINFIIDKIVFLLALGAFYAVLSRTAGYKKVVSNIVGLFKGNEEFPVIFVSVVTTLLASLLSQSFVVLIFIPFFISIFRNLGINKTTTFAATFGAMLVGILGATYGYEGLTTFDAYFSQSLTGKTAMKMTLGYRSIILFVGLALYNFFLAFAVNKSVKNKDKNEAIEEEYAIDTKEDKKAAIFPVVIVMFITAIISILGFIDWSGMFNINIFNDFHEWLVGLKFGKDFALIANLLGRDVTALGTWNLYNISFVLVFFTILTGILYSFKLEDFFNAVGKGVRRVLKPIGAVVAVYAIFVASYMTGIVPKMANDIMKTNAKPEYNIDYNGSQIAFFNVDIDGDKKADTNLINQDIDSDGKCDLNCDTNKDGYPDSKLDFNADGIVNETDENIIQQLAGGVSILNEDVDGDGIADVNVSNKFNLVKLVAGSALVDIFNNDLGYSGYSMGSYLISSCGGSHLKLTFLVFVTVFGLLQFFVPSSIILVLGLSYSDVSLCDWLKYAWRFILGMLCIMLLIFIFILII